MAYTRLTAQEKQARKESRQNAKDEEKFFDDLFWNINNYSEMEVACYEHEEARYTHEEAMMMVKLAYEAGKASS